MQLDRELERLAAVRIPRGGLGIKEGAVIATPRTVYMGHGFEGITDEETRNEIMSRAIDHLLP